MHHSVHTVEKAQICVCFPLASAFPSGNVSFVFHSHSLAVGVLGRSFKSKWKGVIHLIYSSYRIGLEGTLKIIKFQPPSMGRETLL